MKRLSIFILLAILSTSSLTPAQTMDDAQKAYVKGNWKEAADAYEAACPKEPKDKQDECYLWNILALSQTGDIKSFKVAGKRLDSLIQNTNPQKSIYADLMMTSAQFRLYLGKYDKAAEHLIHAIETSKPHQNVVLQKVCQAVKLKVHSETLDDRCELLKKPDSLAAIQNKLAESTATPAAISDFAAKPTAPQAAISADTTAPQTAKATPNETIPVAPAASKVDSTTPVAAPSKETAPAPVANPVSTPAPQPTDTIPQEYWVLQLGAFGTKSNADLLVSNLKKQKITCAIVEMPRGDKILYLVQTGRFDSREQAVDFAANKLVPLKIEYQPLMKK